MSNARRALALGLGAAISSCGGATPALVPVDPAPVAAPADTTRVLVAQWGPGGTSVGVAWLDARAVVAVGRDLVVVDPASGLVRGRVENGDFATTSVAARDGYVLAGRLLWDLARDTTREVVAGDGDLLDDGQVVVVRERELVVIDAEGERVLGACDARPRAQPDGDTVACGGRLVSARDGSVVGTLPDAAIDSFSADGASVLLFEGDQLIAADAASGAEKYRVTVPGDDVDCGSSRSVTSSPEGAAFAVTCARASHVLVLDARTGRETGRVAARVDAQLALAPGGSHLAMTTYDDTTVVRVATGEPAWQARGRRHVAFAREGGRLALASAHGVEVVDLSGTVIAPAPIAVGPSSSAEDQIGWSADLASGALTRALLGGFVRVDPAAAPVEVRACGIGYQTGLGVVHAERGLWTGGTTCVALPQPALARSNGLAWFVGGAPVVRIGADGSTVTLAPRASLAAIAEDGSRVVLATDREIAIHDGSSGRRLARRALARTTGVVLSRTGGLVAQLDDERLAWLDARLRTLREVRLGPRPEIAIAPDGSRFAELFPARTLTVVSTSAPDRAQTLALDGSDPDLPARVWFSSDASRIAVVHELPSEQERVEIRDASDAAVIVASFDGTSPVLSRDLRIALVCQGERLVQIEVDTGARVDLGTCARHALTLVAEGRAAWIDGDTLVRTRDGARAHVRALLGERAIAVWRDDAGHWDVQGTDAATTTFAVRTGRSVLDGAIEPTSEGRTPGLAAQLVAP